MGISRRFLLRQIGAAAVGAAAVPALGEASIRPEGPIRLDRNENAYGPSPRAIAAMQEAARTTAHRYPEADTELLRDAIARFHRVSREQIVVGCGSSEILRMAVEAFLGPRKSLIVARPTFQFITDCARHAGADVVTVPLTREYAHDMSAMLARSDSSTGLVYICNPNNPTGTLTPRRDLEAFIRQLPATAFALIDEAYLHYVGDALDDMSFIQRSTSDARVIVTRTFSTVFGLAGLRVGYAVASRETARLLAAGRLPENVNVVAAKAAVASLEDTEHVRLSVVEPDAVTDAGLNEAVAPGGKPVALKLTVPLPVPGFDTCIGLSLGTQAEMAEFWRAWDLLPARQMSM